MDEKINYNGINKKILNTRDLVPVIQDADLVFNSFGYYPVEKANQTLPGIIAKSCIEAGIPMMCLSTNWIGPLYIPDKQNACYFCAINNEKIGRNLVENKEGSLIEKRAFAPYLAISCSIAVIEAMKFLTKIAPTKTG